MLPNDTTGSITLQDILAAIGHTATEVPEGYKSASEWGQHFGLGYLKMHDVLRRARAAGLLDCRKRQIEGIDGRVAWTPCYRLRLR